jgi:ComF family protein
VAEAIARFKYGGEESLGRGLSALIRAALDEREDAAAIDVVVPVPLHVRRLRARGFNQSVLLARHLKIAAARVDVSALQRIRDTPPQAGMSARERRENVAGAFRVRAGCERRVTGANVLLVDDVFTTGSTANECARTLRDAGAARVSIAVISRAE